MFLPIRLPPVPAKHIRHLILGLGHAQNRLGGTVDSRLSNKPLITNQPQRERFRPKQASIQKYGAAKTLLLSL
jgi:hypothetical protein